MADNPETLSAERELKRRGRRRLIGAVTLGLLAFVFLPMLFDSEPKRAGQKDKTEISVQIPSRDGQPPLPAPSPVSPSAQPVIPPPATEPASSPSASTSIAPPVAATPTEKASTAPADAPPAKLAPPPEPAPKAAPLKEARKDATVKSAAEKANSDKHAPDKKGFVVQIGAFSDADKVKEAVAKVKEAGLTPYTESLAVKAGKVTRIRIGPFETREKADAALARIKLSGGDGSIVPLKP